MARRIGGQADALTMHDRYSARPMAEIGARRARQMVIRVWPGRGSGACMLFSAAGMVFRLDFGGT
jgi:hypothetical protein